MGDPWQETPQEMKTLKKALTYRALSLLVTTATGLLLTGSLVAGLGLGLLDGAFKLGLYVAHEKAWALAGGDKDSDDFDIDLDE